MSAKVLVEQRENVLVATLSNPPHGLVDRQMVAELAALAERADTDAAVGGVVLTGAHPKRFVAHYDVAEILAGATASPQLSAQALHAAMRGVGAARRVPGADRALERTPVGGLVEVERFRDALLAIERCSAVWIAALNGDAAGGGCELALACDQRWMADGDHRIGQPEILLGFPPGGGGTQRLTRLLGTGTALRICLDGGTMGPRDAEAIGLVDRVVAGDALLEAAITEAGRLGRRPKAAIGAVKRAVYEGGSLPLVDGLRVEASEFLSTAASDEAVEAMRGYLERMEQLGDVPIGDHAAIDEAVERGRFS